MIILLEKEDSGYFNKADKRLLTAFEAKDYKESLDIIEKIERKIRENIILENDYSPEEVKEYITVEKNELGFEEDVFRVKFKTPKALFRYIFKSCVEFEIFKFS